MLEILRFIFSDLWVWLGVLVYLGLVLGALVDCCRSLGGMKGGEK